MILWWYSGSLTYIMELHDYLIITDDHRNYTALQNALKITMIFLRYISKNQGIVTTVQNTMILFAIDLQSYHFFIRNSTDHLEKKKN